MLLCLRLNNERAVSTSTPRFIESRDDHKSRYSLSFPSAICGCITFRGIWRRRVIFRHEPLLVIRISRLLQSTVWSTSVLYTLELYDPFLFMALTCTDYPEVQVGRYRYFTVLSTLKARAPYDVLLVLTWKLRRLAFSQSFAIVLLLCVPLVMRA